MSDLISEAHAYLARFAASSGEARVALQADGAALADRLRGKAIDLSCNKATEFSPDIFTLHLLAAKVALVALGVGSPGLAVYERDIFYYKGFGSTRVAAEEYDAFKLGYG